MRSLAFFRIEAVLANKDRRAATVATTVLALVAPDKDGLPVLGADALLEAARTNRRLRSRFVDSRSIRHPDFALGRCLDLATNFLPLAFLIANGIRAVMGMT